MRKKRPGATKRWAVTLERINERPCDYQSEREKNQTNGSNKYEVNLKTHADTQSCPLR